MKCWDLSSIPISPHQVSTNCTLLMFYLKSLTKKISATKWLQLQEVDMQVWVYIPNHPFMWGVSSGAMRKNQKRRCCFCFFSCWIFSYPRSLLFFFYYYFLLLLLLLFSLLFPVVDLALLGRCGRGCTGSLLWACRVTCHSDKIHKKLALFTQTICLHSSSSSVISPSDCLFLWRGFSKRLEENENLKPFNAALPTYKNRLHSSSSILSSPSDRLVFTEALCWSNGRPLKPQPLKPKTNVSVLLIVQAVWCFSTSVTDSLSTSNVLDVTNKCNEISQWKLTKIQSLTLPVILLLSQANLIVS